MVGNLDMAYMLNIFEDENKLYYFLNAVFSPFSKRRILKNAIQACTLGIRCPPPSSPCFPPRGLGVTLVTPRVTQSSLRNHNICSNFDIPTYFLVCYFAQNSTVVVYS